MQDPAVSGRTIGAEGATSPYCDLACVVHVHSTFSDGTATVEEIVDAARSAGAEVVLLTDHDSREAARKGYEGWHQGVLLLVGHEVTTRGGHLLAFDVEEEIEHQGLSEVEICEAVTARRGFGFAAHPFSRGGIITSIIRPHPWAQIEECEPLGIELWSLVTDAAERWRSPSAVLRFLRDPQRAMDGPPAENLMQWDRLCATRRVPAIGGLDAHQSGVRIGGRVLSPMPHSRYFRLLRTHVLLEDPPLRRLDADRAAVYGALREGRCYLSVDALASPLGFDYSASDLGGQRFAMGSEVPTTRAVLRATSPQPATLRLMRNGAPIIERVGHELVHTATTPGAYRVEVTLERGGRARTWIISNPIYLRPAVA